MKSKRIGDCKIDYVKFATTSMLALDRASPAIGSGAGCFPDDQLGFHDVLVVKIGSGAVDALQQNLSGGPAHFAERLAHGREARVLVGGALNVVEPDDGDVFGHLQAGLAQGTNGTHGRNIVKGEKR